jgi:ferredoxin-NADP reductase
MLATIKELSMPRVVIGALGFLVLVAFGASFLGGLDRSVFSTRAMLGSLAVLLATSVAMSLVLGRVFRSYPSRSSALITGLILWFLYWPQQSPNGLAWLALIAALAQASKYLIAWRGRHIVNPVAAGVLLSVAVGAGLGVEDFPRTSWWVASEAMFWPVLLATAVVLWRTGRAQLWLYFLAAAGTWTVMALIDINTLVGIDITVFDAIQLAFFAYPIVFFAGFMLTEPLTLPSRNVPQVVAVFVAAAVATIGSVGGYIGFEVPGFILDSAWEWALVATGVIAFATRQSSAVVVLRERLAIEGDAIAYRWELKRPITFTPGQYVELDIAHSKPDRRGRRRAFSPVSVPGEPLEIATRHPEPASSYKRALASMQPGDRARVTSVHGGFVWPKRGPILLIGAGIGVTPFISQLAQEPERDVVVIVGVREEGLPYLERLRELAPDVHALPIDELTVDTIRELVPDLAARHAFISGRPDFVAEISAGLYRKAKKIHTDYFWGS